MVNSILLERNEGVDLRTGGGAEVSLGQGAKSPGGVRLERAPPARSRSWSTQPRVSITTRPTLGVAAPSPVNQALGGHDRDRAHRRMSQHVAPRHSMKRGEIESTLADLSNPGKRRLGFDEDSEEDGSDEEFGGRGAPGGGSGRNGADDEGDDDDDEFGDDDGSEGGGGRGGEYENDAEEDLDGYDDDPRPAALRPSPGYESIEAERYDLLFKLQRLRENGRQGIPNFTVHSDMLELRAAVAMVTKQIAIEGSMRFQKRMLGTVVSALEWSATNYRDVVELELDGWSDKMLQQIDKGEFDDVLTELAEKYSRSGKRIPPELRLLFAVGSSAAAHHLQRSLTKKAAALATLQFAPVEIPAAARGISTRGGGAPQAQARTNPNGAGQRGGRGGSGVVGAGGGGGAPVQPRAELQMPAIDMNALFHRPDIAGQGTLPAPMSTRPERERDQENTAPPPPPTQTDDARANDDARSDAVSEDAASVSSGDSLPIFNVGRGGGAAGRGAGGRKRKAADGDKKIIVI